MHVSQDSWKNAVPELQDRMISMGFEAPEASQAILPQPNLFADDKTGQLTFLQPCKNLFYAEPDLSKFTNEELKQISTRRIGEDLIEYQISGEITPELAEKIVLAAPKKDRTTVEKSISFIKHNSQERHPNARRI